MKSVCLWILVLSLKLHLLEGISTSLNPGAKVIYYVKAQRNNFLTSVTDLVLSAKPRDCSRAPKNTTCVEELLFNDPNLPCEALEQVECDPEFKYRHFDGKCNNPFAPKFGMSGECFLRFVAPEYDGREQFRKTETGKPLPEPRDISWKIFTNRKKLDKKRTFTFVMFGQVVAHDMARAVKRITINCCAPENADEPECMPIKISPEDPLYTESGKSCIEFHRTTECKQCVQKTRAQKNGATPALDASWLYGEDEEKAKKLRAFDGKGQLKYDPQGNLPIVGKDKEDEFCREGQESECFLNGDPRVNQHASLSNIQATWMREHNRIAGVLKQLNPSWGDEELFYESRKILIAELQCIAYKYFFPVLLSDRIMKEFGTYIQNGSTGTNYDPSVRLAVWNEFEAAAFRLHSLIPSYIGSGKYQFENTYSSPNLVREGNATDLLRRSFKAPAEKFDRFLVPDVTKHLYLKDQDLASINIQRGRDHGLAPYPKVVFFCSGGSVKVENFDDLWSLGLMTKRNAKILNKTYESVGDVDLWVGMQLETRMPGAILGPTAVCIIAKQIFFTLFGDKFFFNHEGLTTPPFTADQRSELKKCSLARVMCDNSDIEEIPHNPFFLESKENPQKSCDEISRINLTLWKDSRPNLKIPEVALPSKNNPKLPFGGSL